MRVDNELVLEPGHIHQGVTPSGNVVRIWPTPMPGWWQVCSGPCNATEQPVPEDQISAVLALWGVTVTRWTAHSKGPLHADNPDLEMVRRVAARRALG